MSTNPLIPTQNPALNAMIPPVPPPPSPALGFQVWASDPQNAMKVAHNMTPPNQPLQPNAPSAAANPPMMASAMPPGVNGLASAQPSSLLLPKVAAPSAPNVAAPMPNTAPPSMASVLSPIQSGAQAQLGQDQAEAQRLKQNGAGLNEIQNPFLRTLARVGDIAAPFLLGRGAMAIPGTTAHNMFLQEQQQGRINNDQTAVQNQNQQQLDQANLAHTNAETNLANANIAAMPEKLAGIFAKFGAKPTFDDNNQFTGSEADPNSPVYQKQQANEQAIQATIDWKKAQTALTNAKTGGMDPNSPQFQLLVKNEQDRRVEAGAAVTRATAYYGNYLQGAYNTGLNGQVLPGAPQIADESGNTTTVGSKNASNAIKSQANVAQFNDIDGATTNIENSAKNLVKSGGSLNSPAVAAAIADPKTTSAQWLQGKVANSNLTPAERDYVIQVKAYKENLQTLRKSSGGGVSDAQVDRLMALAPGANTPDLDYLMRQTAQIRALRGRLAQGVSTAKGGLSVHGNPMQPPTAGGKQLDADTATKFLQQAGGDKDKARSLAKQAGYSF